MRIIGIDPGSIKTGYGVIDSNGSNTSYVTSGVIDAKKDSFNNRLKIMFLISRIYSFWTIANKKILIKN